MTCRETGILKTNPFISKLIQIYFFCLVSFVLSCFIGYITLWVARLSVPHIKNCKLDLKFNLVKYNLFKVVTYRHILRICMICIIYYCVFVTFQLKIANKLTFPFWPYTLNCADKKSFIILTERYMVFNRLNHIYLRILKGIQEYNTFQSI